MKILLSAFSVFILTTLPTQAVLFIEGYLEVVSVDPLEIQVEDRSGQPLQFYMEETGLPVITEEKWNVLGRKLTENDLGVRYAYTGTIPDIGGPATLTCSDEGLQFQSKWSQPGGPFVIFDLAKWIILSALALTVILAAGLTIRFGLFKNKT